MPHPPPSSPRACARPAERSSSAATCSSSLAAACARSVRAPGDRHERPHRWPRRALRGRAGAPPASRRAGHRRTHQRTTEAHLRTESSISPAAAAARGGVLADAKFGGRPPYQNRTPSICSAAASRSSSRVVGGSGASRSRKLCSIRPGNGGPSSSRNPPRELRRRPATWQLKQRQRVSVRLGHDPVSRLAHRADRALNHRRQQPPWTHGRLAGARCSFRPRRYCSPPGSRTGEHKLDRLLTQPARNEGQRLRGGRVQPPRVVDDVDPRLLPRRRLTGRLSIARPTRNRSGEIAVAQAECGRPAHRAAGRAGAPGDPGMRITSARNPRT